MKHRVLERNLKFTLQNCPEVINFLKEVFLGDLTVNLKAVSHGV